MICMINHFSLYPPTKFSNESVPGPLLFVRERRLKQLSIMVKTLIKSKKLSIHLMEMIQHVFKNYLKIIQ